jgi:hypothetical protein
VAPTLAFSLLATSLPDPSQTAADTAQQSGGISDHSRRPATGLSVGSASTHGAVTLAVIADDTGLRPQLRRVLAIGSNLSGRLRHRNGVKCADDAASLLLVTPGTDTQLAEGRN